MAGHGPAVKMGEDKALEWKSRLGIKLFVFYSLIYMGFVAITVLKPKAMGMTVVAGVNLAVVYGMGLIVFAIVLGMIYNHMCTKKEIELNEEKSEGGDA